MYCNLLLFVTVCSLIDLSFGLNVRVITFNQGTKYVNVTSSEISTKNINIDENYIRIIYVIDAYNNGQNIVDSVTDFTYMEEFEMKTSQDILPEFKNLPKIKQLSLGKNKFIYIKKETFSDLNVKRLYLDNNEISIIEKKSFGNKLTDLSIRCNNLKTFNVNWFKNISSLEELNMGGNLLTRIEANHFRPMKNLNSFVMSYNYITSIGAGAFTNTNSFRFFYFEHNNIKEIKPNIFLDETIRINYFGINNNNLTFLAPELLDKLKILTSIDLDDNPWQCKCWEVIKKWVPDYLRIFRDPGRPVCVASLSFSEYCVPLVENELIEHFSFNNDPPHYNKDYYCS